MRLVGLKHSKGSHLLLLEALKEEDSCAVNVRRKGLRRAESRPFLGARLCAETPPHVLRHTSSVTRRASQRRCVIVRCLIETSVSAQTDGTITSIPDCLTCLTCPYIYPWESANTRQRRAAYAPRGLLRRMIYRLRVRRRPLAAPGFVPIVLLKGCEGPSRAMKGRSKGWCAGKGSRVCTEMRRTL